MKKLNILIVAILLSSLVVSCIPEEEDVLDTATRIDTIIDVFGPKEVDENQTGVEYQTKLYEGATYTWTVPDGVTIIEGQGSYKIKVDFGASAGIFEVQDSNGRSGSTEIKIK